jgi:hypothetical protein
MKTFEILCCIVLLSGSLFAQTLPLDPETKKVVFTETVTLDSLSKDQLYERSIEWLTNYYKTSTFDVNDKANGKTGTEGNFSISLTYDFKYKSENIVTYNILINQKDGKYRYSLADFSIYSVKTGPKSTQPVETAFQKFTTVNKKEFLSQFDNQVKLITDDLRTTIQSGKVKDKNEW